MLGEFLVDPNKKTVCVYGHLDVQPAAKEDGWATDPFVLTERDGKLYGRGSTDDKGPALSWLWIVEAHQALGVELPVNIKILYEGMEEFGSEGVFETIREKAKEGKFLNDVVRSKPSLGKCRFTQQDWEHSPRDAFWLFLCRTFFASVITIGWGKQSHV